MATRVNKKLLIIVVSCTAIAFGVVAAVAVQQYRQDPTRFLKAGDAALARNDFREAARNYGRAIGKRPNELAFHSKYIDATTKIIPNSADEAQESYLLYVGSLLKRAQIKKNDAALWREVLEERLFQSELNDSIAGWQAMHDLASVELLERVDPSDPLAPTAKAIMGYSQSRRLGALTSEEITKTVATLESALEKVQGDDRDLAFAGLLNITLQQAANLERGGQSRQAGEAWKAFDQLYARATSEVPNGFRIMKTGLERLRLRAMMNDPAVTPAQVSELADRLVARARELGDRTTVFEAAKSVGSRGVDRGMERAGAMLREYVAKNPDAIVHRRALAFCLQESSPDEAEREATAIIEMPQLPVSLAAATQEESRVAAAQQIFDLEFSRLDRPLSEEERAAAIKRLEAAANRIADLAKGLADDSPILKTQGKYLFAKGDFDGADQKFKEVFRKGTLVDVQLYVLASVTAEMRNETGQAQQLVSKGLELDPSNLQLIERSGRLAYRNGRFAEARAAAENILTRDPDNDDAKQLLALAQEGENPVMLTVDDPFVQAIKQAEALRMAGQTDKAREIGAPLLEQYPNDLRVLGLMIAIEGQANNRERALELADRALRMAPDNAALQRLRGMIAGGDDVIARLEEVVNAEKPKEPERTIFKAIRFAQAANAAKADAERLKDSNPTESARQAAFVPRLEAAAEEWKQKAIAADPLHPAWLDFRLSNALLARDFDTAAAVVAEAERSGRSPATISLFRGRLALAQGRAGEAAALLQRSIDANVDDADVFRLLGLALEQAGDLSGAVKSYAEAYRRRPTDPSSAKTYVAGLAKAGDRAGALTVLRDLRKVAPSDEDGIETWLDLEAEIGDQQLARKTRQARYEVVPGDRRNALKYATMLAERQPGRTDIVDTALRVKYTEAAWQALEERVRQSEIDKVRRIWHEESDAIFAELIMREPASIELALIRSATYRRQGRYQEAESALRDLIGRAGAKATPDMHVAMGVHFTEIDDTAKAAEAFAAAVALQSEQKREADASIGEYFFGRGLWDRAVGHLERVYQVRPERGVALRLAETYSRLGRFEDARARIVDANKLQARDQVIFQLEGSIAEGYGNKLAAEGKKDEAIKIYDEGLAALAEAAKSAAYNPIIAVQQAALHRKKFDASGQEEFLDAAFAAADRATKLRGDYWPAAQAKSDLLLAKRQPAEAILEVERFIKASPSNPDGRRRLISMLTATGKFTRAIEVAREAAQLAPNDPTWRAALAEVHVAAGQLDEAIIAFEQADKLRPSEEYLGRLTELRLNKPTPAWAEVRASLRDREASVKRSPYLQSAIGAALVNTGELSGGLEVFRSSYRAARDAIAAGAANEELIDMWFANLRLVYPVTRTADAEKFLNEISGNRLATRDLRWLAEMWFASGPSGGAKAVEVAERALASNDGKDPKVTARLHDIIGSVRYGEGDCKGALASFAKAVETLPDEPAVLNNFAYLASECGDDPKVAVAAAEKAVLLAPGQSEFLDTLGYAQGRAGMNEVAVATLQKALAAAPSASVHVHLAQVLLAMGRTDDAKTHVRAAGDLKPDPMLQKQLNALIEKLR